MANAYGSDEYNNYIKEYLSSANFEKVDEDCCTFNKMKTTIEHFEYNYKIYGCTGQREKTIITIVDKHIRKHTYQCIDEFLYPYEFSYNGCQYIIFRKTLYGYTILNLDDFTEINYFPSEVINGSEAFIICEVKIFKDLLILGGCFWGGPYECYALSLGTFEIANISRLLGIKDVQDNEILNHTELLLIEGHTNIEFKIKYEELINIINQNHSNDL